MAKRVGRCLVVVLLALLAPQAGVAAPIEEGYFATINGLEQWITIRGRDSRNPILLFLHGGPGAAQSGTAPLFSPWEETFTVVHGDQPMSGATYAKNIGRDVGPLTIERYTRDGIAATEHVLMKVAPVLFAPPPPDATYVPRGLPGSTP